MRVLNPNLEQALISVIEQGLPLVPRPYADIALQIGCSEQEVIEGLQALKNRGDIKRFGVVVRHRKLGYRANGMVVWDVPDDEVKRLGHCMGQYSFVTLCYRRPRQLPEWGYNLFTMVHGRNRQEVEKKHNSWLSNVHWVILNMKFCLVLDALNSVVRVISVITLLQKLKFVPLLNKNRLNLWALPIL